MNCITDKRIAPKPLIKWAGGKFAEFRQFKHLVPPFKKYYEPFFGGGGVFFALQTEVPAFVNDKSEDLVNFYRLIGNKKFEAQLYLFADGWEQATCLASDNNEQLLQIMQQYFAVEESNEMLHQQLKQFCKTIIIANYPSLFDEQFIVDEKSFRKCLILSLKNKIQRVKDLQQKHSFLFDNEKLSQHLETGIKTGLYNHFRSLVNTGNVKTSKAKAAANWFFVREFCYASMFRYNNKGHFNVPYGGIAYNSKNLRLKIEAITADSTKMALANAKFYNLDFAEFLELTQPSTGDFVFIDPPYDSEFSEYDQNAFTKADQVRLRDYVLGCKAKCMIVIKETAYIEELYSSKNFHIVRFDKSYTYNVRGRNNRDTRHLVILNYAV